MRNSKVAVAILFTFFVALTSAQTNTWTGAAGDADWQNSSNWSLVEVPTSVHDVSLPSTANVTITANATCQSLTLIGVANLKVEANLTVTNDLTIGSEAIMEWRSDQLQVSGVLSNAGTLLLTQFTERQLHATVLNNDGILNIQNTNLTRVSGGSVINNSTSGSIIIDSVGGMLSNLGEATINNQGLIQKTSSTGDFSIFYLIVKTNNTGTIDVTEDQTLLIVGGAAELNNLETGIIQGSGIYDITGEFTNIGFVAPGGLSTVGTLFITNIFTIETPGTIDIDLGGAALGEYDRIEVTGSPTVQADLQLNLLYEAVIGDTFDILTATPSGIATCDLPETTTAVFLDQLYTFSVSCLANQIRLEVTDKVLSVAEEVFDEPEFIINPNPVSEQTTFLYKTHNPTESNYQGAIYNILGQQMARFNIQPNVAFTFDRDKLKSGIYMVQISNENQVISSAKMVIR